MVQKQHETMKVRGGIDMLGFVDVEVHVARQRSGLRKLGRLVYARLCESRPCSGGERQNRHVYARGMQLRKGFATTFGNVVAGAGDLSRPRRAKLVTDHENVHAWQARWFGPAYPALYAGWLAGGAAAGAAVWAAFRRDQRLFKIVESCAYYLNPFEWWAYSRDDHWPPNGIVDRLGWKLPAVQPFAAHPATTASAGS